MNCYEYLAIDPGADEETIRKARDRLLFDERNHPDRGGKLEVAQQINEASETLLNPRSRLIHDALLLHRLHPLRTSVGPKSRAHHRESMRVPATITFVVDPKRQFAADVLDFSVSGVRFSSLTEPVVEERVTVECDFFEGEGKVVWTRAHRENKPVFFETGMLLDRFEAKEKSFVVNQKA